MLPSGEWRYTWNKTHRRQMSRVNETENHGDINLGSWFPMGVFHAIYSCMQYILHWYKQALQKFHEVPMLCMCIDTVDFNAVAVGMMQLVLHSHPDHCAIQPSTLWLSCQAFNPELWQQAETSALLLRLFILCFQMFGGLGWRWTSDWRLEK